MDTLQDRFHRCCSRMGISGLCCDFVSTAAGGVRFQIGGEEPIYLGDHRRPNGLYIENAVDRAMAIYEKLPAPPDILRIDDCPELSLPGLPAPDQTAGSACYWRIPEKPVFLRKLLREIVRAELDAAGMENLVSNVYFLNSEKDILFRLYDDRSAEAAAADPESLQPLSIACREWLKETNF